MAEINPMPQRALIDTSVLVAVINVRDSQHARATAAIRSAISANLVQHTKGRLNFNDALIVVACRELGINTLLSFDADFDTIPDLTRLK